MAAEPRGQASPGPVSYTSVNRKARGGSEPDVLRGPRATTDSQNWRQAPSTARRSGSEPSPDLPNRYVTSAFPAPPAARMAGSAARLRRGMETPAVPQPPSGASLPGMPGRGGPAPAAPGELNYVTTSVEENA